MKKIQTHWQTEALAGLTTFLTMAYIVVVNPVILSDGTGMPFSGALTATVLLAFSMTLFMGLYAKLPFAVAPGMGINAFFTYSIILEKQVPWPTALGMVFWSGVLFLLISVTPIRAAIARAIPKGLRSAAAAGIGVFLAFIGLKNAGFIVGDPVTIVKMGQLSGGTALSLVGMGLTAWLLGKKSPLAFLAGIATVTALGVGLGLVTAPDHWVDTPDFTSVFLKMDVWGALKLALLPTIISLLFTDLFDSISTFVGVCQATGLVDKEGQPLRLKEGLLVDAVATLLGGPLGTSSGTAYIESSAGIEMGGRTGLTSVFTALCFLPCFFLAPLAGMVPPYATAPVLVLVGALMFRTVGEISFKKIEDALPAYLTIILIPLTFSITQGILWGFISHVGLYVVNGRGREVSLVMYGIGLLSVALMILEHT